MSTLGKRTPGKLIIGGALAAVTLAAATPAFADRGRDYSHRGDDTTGAAIAGGIVGLALGAAIGSSHRDHDRDDYDGPRYPRYRAYYVYHDYPRYYPAYREDWHDHRGWDRRQWWRNEWRRDDWRQEEWRRNEWRREEWREHRGW